MGDLRKVWRSLDVLQYCIDHTELVDTMCDLMESGGVKGRMILDKTMFGKITPWHQPYKVRALRKAGCEIRLRQPPEGKYSSMHMKCCLCDARVLYTGSVNMTHNGMEHSDEDAMRIEDAGVVAKYLKQFQTMWDASEPLRQEDLDQAIGLRERNKR